MTHESNLAETHARLFPKQAHQPIGVSPASWITLSVGYEQKPGVPRGNALFKQCLQNLVGEAIDQQGVAWIDIVVVNRDGWMKAANLAQRLPEERPLPNVELERQRQKDEFRRAIRNLALDYLSEMMLIIGSVCWQHGDRRTCPKSEKTSCKRGQARGLFLSLRPTSCCRLDFARQDEDRSGHASFDQLSSRRPPMPPTTIGASAFTIHRTGAARSCGRYREALPLPTGEAQDP